MVFFKGTQISGWIWLMFLGLILSSFFWSGTPELTIFLAGDSTMADKPDAPEVNPERGWGQLLPELFSAEVIIENHAVNGRSTKSFIDEGRWQTIVDKLKSGDYVFIQFGHNDSKINDPKRYTNPYSGYRRNLEKMADEVLAKGAYPILFSSIVRRQFNMEGTLVDTHFAYPFIARQVAKDKNVPFIDMQVLTEDLVNELGVEESKAIYLHIKPDEFEKLPEGREDDTHLSFKGAKVYADLVAKEIKRQQIPLSHYLK